MKKENKKIWWSITFSLLFLIIVVSLYAYARARKIQNNLNLFGAELQNAKANFSGLNLAEANNDLKNANQYFLAARTENQKLNFLKFVPYFNHEVKIADQVFNLGGQYLSTSENLVNLLAAKEVDLKSDKNRQAAFAFLNDNKTVIDDFNQGINSLSREFDQVPEFYFPALKQKQHEIKTVIGESKTLSQNLVLLSDILPDLAGYQTAKKYLLLHQNNSEIRPTGGIISAYSIVNFQNGDLKILKTGDSGEIKNKSNQKITPPESLNKYWVNNPDWPFAESNWNPDFSLAKSDIEKTFLAGSGEKTDGIIAIDPEFVSQFLDITGPIKLANYPQTFDKNNMLELLQKQVEIDYKSQNIAFDNRKKIIGELSAEILTKILNQNIVAWPKMLSIFKKGLDEKHVLIFSNDQNLEKKLAKENWTGEMKKTDGDYLAIIDANFGGWKTNRVLEEDIDYRVNLKNNLPTTDLKINYKHEGVFDWRTSIYKTLTRVFAPLGSRLIDSNEGIAWETSVENGKTVFSGYFMVEPKTEKTIELKYQLPDKIGEEIQNKTYNLIIQKQAGTDAFPLKVNINDEKKFKTNLEIDREFSLK